MKKAIDFSNDSPLYVQIEKLIKGKIARGELKPGEQINSQHELAREFNVSLITVKKALVNLVNSGILFTRVGLGTYVAEKPVQRIFDKGHSIGLVLRDLKHQYFSLIVHSIEERVSELGFNLLIASSSGDSVKEDNQINHFRKLGVDGLIIASLSLEYRATDYIKKIHDENFPYVMVSYIHDPEYWYVGSDHEFGSFMATEHLIKNGYRSIGYVHAGKGNLLGDVRKNGYTRALMEYDIPFDSKIIYILNKEPYDTGADRFHQGYLLGKEFVKFTTKPEALFFYSDSIALGFEKAVLEEGLKIPDDIALVGFDDILLSEYAAIPLTTIHQPVDKIGRMAVDVIDKRINKLDVNNRIIMRPSILVRETCGARKRAEDSFKIIDKIDNSTIQNQSRF